MNKAITSFALVQLFEKGLIGLDNATRDHMRDLPPFEVVKDFDKTTDYDEKRPATKEVTFKHLLTHNAGLGLWFNSAQIYCLGEVKKMRPIVVLAASS